jgi:hypothetical protein
MKDPIKTGRRRKDKSHALVPNVLKTAHCFHCPLPTILISLSTQHSALSFSALRTSLPLRTASVIPEGFVKPETGKIYYY